MNVIKQTLHKANLHISDIKYFFFTQNSKNVLSNVINNLNIRDEQLCITMPKYGHIGSVDIFLAWDICNSNNKLHSGDYIMLVSAGIGYNFGSCLIRI